MGRKRKEAVDPKTLRGFKLLRCCLDVLQPLRTLPAHGNRQFLYHDYVMLMLLSFFNPVLDSLRSLQRASELEKVRQVLGVPRVSLGSLSESAGQVFDPVFMEPILNDLAERAKGGEVDPRLDKLLHALVAADGSFLKCLPSMVWALFRHQSKHRGVKMHVQLDVASGVPLQVNLTAANASEKKVLRKHLRQAVLYILDRGYIDYSLFQAIHDAGSLVVARLKDNSSYTVLEDRPLRRADRAAGVVCDQYVAMGSSFTRGHLTARVRRLVIRGQDGREIVLLTNSELPAELIGLIYRYRWQVELFFRWFKCILGCTHWMSRTESGVTLQVYVAILASILVSLWTGRKPTKALFQLICLYLQGWASEKELARAVESFRQKA